MENLSSICDYKIYSLGKYDMPHLACSTVLNLNISTC